MDCRTMAYSPTQQLPTMQWASGMHKAWQCSTPRQLSTAFTNTSCTYGGYKSTICRDYLEGGKAVGAAACTRHRYPPALPTHTRQQKDSQSFGRCHPKNAPMPHMHIGNMVNQGARSRRLAALRQRAPSSGHSLREAWWTSACFSAWPLQGSMQSLAS